MKSKLLTLIAIVSLLIPTSALAVIKFDTAVSGKTCSACTSLTFTITATTTPNTLLWVNGFTSSAGSLTGVTASSTSMVNLVPVGLNVASQGRDFGFYLIGVASGTVSIVLSAAGSTNIFAGAATWAGVQQFGTSTTATASSTTALDMSLTTNLNNSLVLGSMNNGPGSPTAGVQTLQATADVNGVGIFYSTSTVSSSVAVGLHATAGSAGNWGGIIASFSSDTTSTPVTATRAIIGIGKTRPNSR